MSHSFIQEETPNACLRSEPKSARCNWDVYSTLQSFMGKPPTHAEFCAISHLGILLLDSNATGNLVHMSFKGFTSLFPYLCISLSIQVGTQ